MMDMGGMGGGNAGHMAVCPLCRGEGQVPAEMADEISEMMAQEGDMPSSSADELASAMRPGMRGGYRGM